MSKVIGIKLLSTAAILLATVAVSQASLIGKTEAMKPRATIAGDQQHAVVGSDMDGLAQQQQKFDFDELSVTLSLESQDCASSNECIGLSILKLKDLDRSQRQNAVLGVPVVTSVTMTLEKYVADCTWSASTAQKRSQVIIPQEVSESDQRGRDGEILLSSAATLALIGTSLLGLGLAGRRSRHRTRRK